MSRLVASVLFALGVALLPLLAFAEWASVSTKQANVREGPGVSRAVEYQAWIYSPLQVLTRKGEWVQVRDFEKDTGWVHNAALSDAATVVVKSEKANIRSGPGTKSPVVWQVDRGYPFLLVEQNGVWLHVKDDEDIDGWVNKAMVWGNIPAQSAPQ